MNELITHIVQSELYTLLLFVQSELLTEFTHVMMKLCVTLAALSAERLDP